MLVCAECHHKLIGFILNDTYYYRCNHHLKRGLCTHNHSTREDLIEKWLLENLEREFERCCLDWKVKMAEKRKSALRTDKAALKRKLQKLKELYVNELIDIEDYKKDYEIYTAALQKLPEPQIETLPNFDAMEKLLKSDYKNIYETLTREEKRTLWRSVISEIQIDNEDNIMGISFG